jgi:hypothetical protein
MSHLGGDAIHMVLLIARREFMTRVRSRFFLIGTAVLVVLLAGFILQAEVLNRTTNTVKVGFVGASQVLAQPLAAASAGRRYIGQPSPRVPLAEAARSGTPVPIRAELPASVSPL